MQSLAMTNPTSAIRKSLPEGWAFAVKEVSAGVYRIVGEGPRGLSVERTGTDEVVLLLQAIEDAEEISRR
jgi:hypothetical protein